MRWALGALIVVGASAVMIVAILLVRRRAPEGGYFNDGDRASGVFGVLATGFALLLGFVIFLAFTKYDESRAGAEAEALAVVQLFETAQLMPPDAGPQLAGEVECYARSVVNLEWPAMEAGVGSKTISPWGLSMFRTLQTVEPETASRAERVRLPGSPRRAHGRRHDVIVSTRRKGSSPCRVDRAAPLGGAGPRLPALLRRQRRTRRRPGVAGGLRHRGGRRVPARAVDAEPTLRPGCRGDPAGRDAAVPGDHRVRSRRARHRRAASLRCGSGSRCELLEQGTLEADEVDRHDRGRAARARGGRDGVEQLPGEPLDG